MKAYVVWLSVFIWSLPLCAGSQVEPAFIQMFNEGKRAQIIQYLSEHMAKSQLDTYGLDAQVDMFLGDQATYGKLTFVKTLPDADGNDVFEVISGNNQFKYNLTINKEPQEPHKINYFEFLSAGAVDQAKTPVSAREFAQELSGFLNNLASHDAFSGAVLVAKGKEVIFKDAVGFADRRWKVKNTVDTRFSLASMNKMFTAIAALQLIEQGKLKFDDKLIQFVDKSWLPMKHAEAITIRHLLTHTSGLGNFFNDEFIQSNKEIYRDLAGYKPLIAKSELLFTPGSQNRYSNSGMLMLGLVIEKVSGESYYDYIQKHIYDKANMPGSGSFELDSTTENIASGYLKRMHSDDWVDSVYTREIKGSPAGGGFSTIDDLYQFALALTEFKLLGKALTEQAYSAKTEFNSAPWYGYGFAVGGKPDNRIVGHSGAYLGVDSRLDIHLDKGFVVVILANQSGVVGPMRRKINELIALYQ
ncbi:serine hydrolase [Rheinheimera sp.]|uniref:serine hydrolase domain-containing protein n=1 Tax=Rheinheimera sp. TaxID=1869214 RepID=UPI00262C85AE|nr:serine hydrolase domain-containing protein [Rheinheimera sp.]MCA1928699.1 beta-lactamase family protein [Rheinheimera sp.]